MNIIDTGMHGLQNVTAVFLLRGKMSALIETGPQTCAGTVLDGLKRAGVHQLDWIIVTHIHLDHAGAAGTIAAHFPEARIGVHPAGERHLVDPTRLWSSVKRVYGPRTEEMWGQPVPIDANRVHALKDSDVVDLGGARIRAIETRGHAPHHHAYLEETSGTLFAGDAMGVRLPSVATIRPSTPPPDFNLEQTIASINRIRSVRPATLQLTHFGSNLDGIQPISVDDLCDVAIEQVLAWRDLIKRSGICRRQVEDVIRSVSDSLRAGRESKLSEEEERQLNTGAPVWLNVLGYRRYLESI